MSGLHFDDDEFSPEVDPVVRQKCFIERPCLDHIDKIHMHPKLREEDRRRMKGYTDAVKRAKGELTTIYVMYRKYGRYFARDNQRFCGLTMNKVARATLYASKDLDLDIRRCHLQLLINLAEGMGAPAIIFSMDHEAEFLARFHISESDIVKCSAKHRSTLTKRDLVKDLITRAVFGGGKDEWFADWELPNFILPDVYYELKQNVDACTRCILSNPKYDDIKKESQECYVKKKKREYEKAHPKKKRLPKGETKAPDFDPSLHVCPPTKHIAVILQNEERIIIEAVIDYVATRGREVSIYAYDGLHIRKNPNAACTDAMLLNGINDEIGTHHNVNFIYKPFASPYTGFDKISLPDHFDHKQLSYTVEKADKIKYLEKYILKILTMGHFSYVGNKGEMCIIKNEAFYFGCHYFPFFYEYARKNEDIPIYQYYDTYPVKEKCPKHVYNLWRGFEFEQKKYEHTKSNPDISRFLYHFKVTADEIDYVDDAGEKAEGPLTKYLLDWYAHVVQKPDKKTGVCILLQGLPGCGKNTIAEDLMRRILGEQYIRDTPDIEKITGKFNSTCKNALLIVLNEAAGKDTGPQIEKIKDSITRTYLQLEHKGIDPINMRDLCNYIYTTNNWNPIAAIDEHDRRFVVAKCSSKYVKDQVYFDALHADIENDGKAKAFFEFLQARDIKNFHPEKDRVISEAALDIHELNRHHLLDWFDWTFLAMEDSFNRPGAPQTRWDGGQPQRPDPNEPIKTVFKCHELYKNYKRWWTVTGRRIDGGLDIRYFGKSLRLIEDERFKILPKKDGYQMYSIAYDEEVMDPGVQELIDEENESLYDKCKRLQQEVEDLKKKMEAPPPSKKQKVDIVPADQPKLDTYAEKDPSPQSVIAPEEKIQEKIQYVEWTENGLVHGMVNGKGWIYVDQAGKEIRVADRTVVLHKPVQKFQVCGIDV